ncbi:hypothetical protein PHYSODRAFT_298329 [Phytophthora sojae]|uniref:Uncharacterized protein n=1 Tax=Phytophthora sojae (strain P6497) TaxID=1094619 RepID=G4Z318_PHYSP|nr:hypothetical protein PHYSODRAFT_298329 [Phytophthora sojae]EGZ20047.1 hypothetical protein PHYSODRAFT_298329 [Phytophthora sojae]|eukprot:XP_009522764.1 hypothetical protein PHYSODRAFT_298329 [Phytophthora sojae]
MIIMELALLASAQDNVAAPEIPLTATTLFAPFKYHHYTYLDSNDSFSSLEFLPAYEFGRDGTFEVTLDFSLALNSSRDGVDGRVLFYLLVCDEPATEAIADITALYTPPIVYTTGKPAKTIIIEVTAEGTHPDMHCAMPNRTLDYYCKSYPLENQSPNSIVYQSTKTISDLVDNITRQAEFSKVSGLYSNTLTKLSFFIDACELLGANRSILRSCMEFPPPVADNYYLATGNKTPCFFYPENYPNRSEAENERWSRECIMTPQMQYEIKGTVSMNLCTASGKCFQQPNSALAWFYFSMIVLWSLLGLVWMAQMACAPSDTVLDLHRKIALVPVVQVIYASVAYAAQLTAGMYLDWQRGILPSIAMAFQLVAFVTTVETLLYLAKGWNITLRKLNYRESSAIRVVVVTWVVMFITD